MRVLIATYSDTSHLLGMVPLGWALRTAGHEVRVASQPKLTTAIESTGLTAVPVGTDHRFFEILAAGGEPQEEEFDLTEERPDRLTWEALREGYRQIVPWWWSMINKTMIDDLTAFCRWWSPDLVLWEPLTFAGPIAAKASGAAHARFLWSLDFFARMRDRFLSLMHQQPPEHREDPLALWLGARLRKLGEEFTEDVTRGHFTVDHVPPSLRLAPVPGVDSLSVRYVPYNGRAVVPSWLREPPRRPRVCVSLGISATDWYGGYIVPVQDVLDALGGIDAEIVLTLDAEQASRLHRVPDNTRVVGYVPLHALMPTCSAMINHGGPGTVFTGLAYGVPQLVLPNQFDAPALAANLAAQGAGLTVPGAEANGTRVRALLQRLLEEPSFRENAERLRQEMLGMPAPNQLVPVLEELTERHRYSTRTTAHEAVTPLPTAPSST
ncbi:activator-dependent family glycosyltransferase [Nonomuraea sp. SYSU D8015]|uniref:activator-dependent family glycosyltransferase n=1 Tax=Nonomuraea sp. SYSU D8015 TaxID=2593644 RepID=UPI0016612D56|nr:activator-dependent family glycosyltransferase [Nonomuraea sp. SYSU D8015]